MPRGTPPAPPLAPRADEALLAPLAEPPVPELPLFGFGVTSLGPPLLVPLPEADEELVGGTTLDGPRY